MAYIMAYIKSIWRGDGRLVITYWVWGVVGGNLVSIPDFILDESGVFHPSYELTFVGGLALVLYGLFQISYYVFISVAIWRSAVKYQGSGVWSALARVIVVGVVLMFVVQLIRAF